MSEVRAKYFERIMRHLLPTPGLGLSAANFYLNFLFAATQSFGCYQPEKILIHSIGEYFALEAFGRRMAFTNNAIRSFPEIFDIANFQTMQDPEGSSNIFPGFIYLAPIVRSAEYCLVDIPTEMGMYRQAFFQGSPLDEARMLTRPISNDNVLGFFFTLPADTYVFEDTRLDVQTLKQSLLYWQKKLLRRVTPKGVNVPKFRTKWNIQSAYHHSLRIDFQYSPPPRE